MSVEYLNSDIQQRCVRIMNDARKLAQLPRGSARVWYHEIEAARDALSRLLDHADGKDA